MADQRALDILGEAYRKYLDPNTLVVNAPSREVLLNAGNVHCITQQQPAEVRVWAGGVAAGWGGWGGAGARSGAGSVMCGGSGSCLLVHAQLADPSPSHPLALSPLPSLLQW